jgi:exodeoxyribonuclease V alpha subunit
VERVRRNPYILAKDSLRIGFKTADQIAEKVGIPKIGQSGPRRYRPCPAEATNEGHCALPVETLKAAAVPTYLYS